MMLSPAWRADGPSRSCTAPGRIAARRMRGSCKHMIRQPHYIDVEEAREVLAQIGVQLTLRQMQRVAEQDGQGRRKLPFVDPIERKLKIEKNDLISRAPIIAPNFITQLRTLSYRIAGREVM